MRTFSKKILCIVLGIISINASADDAASQVQIPGYSPPSHPADMPSTPPATAAEQTTPSFPKPPATPEAMNKSCQKYIAPGLPISSVQDYLKNVAEQSSVANVYEWVRDGEPNLIITFTNNDNTPVDVKGNIPINIPNAKDMNFSLNDVQKALNMQGKNAGHVYVFSQKQGNGKITIHTNGDDVVTSYTTTFSCE